MKTTLTFTKKSMRGIPVGKAGKFPAMRDPIRSTIDSRLGEDEGLFINYGMFSDSLPYTMLDDYDVTPEQDMVFECAVLENDHLRAEFLPELGGRLWSLFDKDHNRELLGTNTKFLPRNLAIRNAWFASGIEFNCGRRGHDPNTCQMRFTAELEDPEFGPVLRVYDYSRDRKAPFQTDFFLPEDSHFLLMRARIFNPNTEVTPMYWWSNMGLDMTPGCRVVVPAEETYLNMYDAGSHFISKIPMPYGEGFDHTYPENFRIVRDHFYDIPENTRKYVTLFNRDGSGFLHMSTRRLQGRKMFVWGRTTGGDNWQRKLLAPGQCDYMELQAGLAKSQQECLPMPPRSSWEWLEAYGSISAAPEDVFGSWEHAMEKVTAIVDGLMPESRMNEILSNTRERISLKKGTLRFKGDGNAALEELRSGEKLAPQLDYGTPGDDEAEWVNLLNNGTLDDEAPRSFTVDRCWKDLLLKAPESWKKNYHLSLYYFREKDWERAVSFIQKALSAKRNAWTLHACANIMLGAGADAKAALELMIEAASSAEADAYLIKEAFKLLVIHEHYEGVFRLYDSIPPEYHKRPNIKAHYASALFHTGDPQKALDVLIGDGPLDLVDVREGETFLTGLYLDIQHALGKKDDEIQVPPSMDFRTK